MIEIWQKLRASEENRVGIRNQSPREICAFIPLFDRQQIQAELSFRKSNIVGYNRKETKRSARRLL